MLVEMASEEEGTSVSSGTVVLLDGCGKVMVGTDKESETEVEGETTPELGEVENDGRSGGADEEESVGAGGIDEEESVGAGGASEEAEEEGGGGKIIELMVLKISPGSEEEEGGGGVGIMLETIELMVLKISPESEEEEGGLGGFELGASEADVVEGGLAIWLVMEETSLTTELRTLVRSLTTESTPLVRPPTRPPSEEVEVAGGGVIEAESDVEVGVPEEEEPESVVETGSNALVVDDDEPGSTSETTLPTPDTTLERPPTTPPMRPPSLDDEGAGVMEELSAVEVNELVSLGADEEPSEEDEELSGGADESVGDEELLLSTPPLPPSPPRPKPSKAPLIKPLTSCLFAT
jgi:hypothetical protein